MEVLSSAQYVKLSLVSLVPLPQKVENKAHEGPKVIGENGVSLQSHLHEQDE